MPPNQAPKPAPRGRLAALLGIGAATTLMATVAMWEGKENTAYRDVAGIYTICYGDTANVRPGQRASDSECIDRLERQLLNHAEPVLRCVPQLRGRDNQLAAFASLAYNIGVRAACNSTAAKRFRAGDFRGGCDAFLAWDKARVNGRLVPIRGLQRRRAHEREICLRGL